MCQTLCASIFLLSVHNLVKSADGLQMLKLINFSDSVDDIQTRWFKVHSDKQIQFSSLSVFSNCHFRFHSHHFVLKLIAQVLNNFQTKTLFSLFPYYVRIKHLLNIAVWLKCLAKFCYFSELMWQIWRQSYKKIL